jgi:uncharacterized protein involved in exopolysaccharide biosynthesis
MRTLMDEKLPESHAKQNAGPVPEDEGRLVYVMPVTSARPDVTDEFDLLSAWRILWRARWLIAVITALITTGALLYALTAKEWYSAETLLLPAAPDSSQGGLAGELGGLAGLASSLTGVSLGGADATEPLAVLRSRGFTRTFIEKHGLLTILFADKWDASAGKWKPEEQSEWPDIHDAVKYFDEDVRRVREDKKTGLVTVTVDWTDRETAARWANLLVSDLNDLMRQRALHEAEANLEYLKQELNASNLVTMQQSIGRLLETQMQKVMLAKGKEEFAFRVVDSASPPKWRDRPKRVQIVALGMAAGIIFSTLVAFLLHAVREQKSTEARGAAARSHERSTADGLG